MTIKTTAITIAHIKEWIENTTGDSTSYEHTVYSALAAFCNGTADLTKIRHNILSNQNIYLHKPISHVAFIYICGELLIDENIALEDNTLVAMIENKESYKGIYDYMVNNF